MSAIADFLIAAANLIEAESRALQRGFLRFLLGCLLLMTGVLAALSGFGLFLWGIYQLLAAPMGSAASAVVTGVIAFIAACFLALIARLLA